MYDPRYDIDMGNEIPGSTPTHYSPQNDGKHNHGYGSAYGGSAVDNEKSAHYYY